MQEPRACVISDKAYCHVVRFDTENIAADGNDISTDRINIVICVGSCTSDDIEGMLGTESDKRSF